MEQRSKCLRRPILLVQFVKAGVHCHGGNLRILLSHQISLDSMAEQIILWGDFGGFSRRDGQSISRLDRVLQWKAEWLHTLADYLPEPKARRQFIYELHSNVFSHSL